MKIKKKMFINKNENHETIKTKITPKMVYIILYPRPVTCTALCSYIYVSILIVRVPYNI